MQNMFHINDGKGSMVKKDSHIFFRAYHVELYKMVKRKDTLLLFTIAIVPLVFSIGYIFGRNIFTFSGQKMDALTFISQMVCMGISLFIFLFFYAIYSARIYATEVEQSSLLLYVYRIHARSQIFHAKMAALHTVLILALTCTLILGLVSYYGILVPGRPDIVTGTLYQAENIMNNIGLCLACLITYSVTIQVVMCLCSYVKFLPSIIVYLVIFFAWQMVIYVPVLQYFSPYFYISEFSRPDNGMSKLGLSLPLMSTSTTFLACILLLAVYWCVTSFLGIKKLKSLDLA